MEAATGINSPQYSSVRKSYFHLTKHLRLNNACKTALIRLYITKGWLAPGASPSEDELIAQVMGRIEERPEVYDEFIAMLNQIHGIENIVKNLTDFCATSPKVSTQYHAPKSATPGSPDSPARPPETKKIELDSQMSEFTAYVKAIYRTQKVDQSAKWPPRLSTEFINLALIDGKSKRKLEEIMARDGNIDVVLGEKKEITITEVACNLPGDRRLVLLVGAPGVGKSTLAWEYCRRWERGEIATEYELVLLVKLREGNIRTAKCLYHVIFHPSAQVRQGVAEELIKSRGAKVLIVLEGFDELPDECRRDGSFFLELIHGQILPEATILITSRPWATRDIRERCQHSIFQHIEILGFTNDQITQYIHSALPEEQSREDLEEYLKIHPQIKTCMYIPLNIAIIVGVYQDSQTGGCNPPRTSTELYMALSRALLLRHLRGDSKYSNIKCIRSFENDLPPEVYKKFAKLCELAYNGIVNENDQVQLIFTDLPSDFDSLGFMDSVTEVYVIQDASVSYNYLHFSLQEYLAAVHISTMLPVKQLEYFKKALADGRYRAVGKFLAGLTNISVNTIIKSFFTNPSTDSIDGVSCDISLTEQHTSWLFELQCTNLISTLLKEKTIECSISYGHQPLDFYCLGYSIVHSDCQWALSMGSNVGEEEMKMLVAGINTRQETSPKCKVVGLQLYNTLISPNGINTLFINLWDNITMHLKSFEFYLDSNEIPGFILVLSGCDGIKKLLTSSNCLQYLGIKIDMQTFPNVVYNMHIRFMEIVTKAIASNDMLPLRKLEMSAKFSDTAAQYLSQFIKKSATLQSFTMLPSIITADGLQALVQAMHQCPSLPKGDLKILRCEVNGDREASVLRKLLAGKSDNVTISLALFKIAIIALQLYYGHLHC